MYLERLLKDIGIEWDLEENAEMWSWWESINWKTVWIVDDAEVIYYTPLSDILIKNYWKIYSVYESNFQNRTLALTELMQSTFLQKLVIAIKNGTEEDFARSLYNNK